MTVAEFCNDHVVVVTPAASIIEAARLMRDRHVGCVVVTANADVEAAPVGILTDRDIVVAVLALNLDPEEATVGDVMSGQLHTIGGDEELVVALDVMRTKGVRRLPVLDDQSRLIGIVSADELLALLADQISSLASLVSREQRRERERRRVMA